jgi:hypothetical protein
MYIDDLFHSPANRIAAFSQMQLHLYRHDVSLQDYFLPIQADTLSSPLVKSSDQRAANRLFTWPILGADKVSQLRPHRKIKIDVLFCPAPYFDRQTERQFLARTLLGLAQTDAKILCLLTADSRFRDELAGQLAAAGRKGQVTFLDPCTPTSRLESRLYSFAARDRAQSALARTVRVLEPHGLGVCEEVKAGFERTAYFVEAWERLAPWVEFDSVVARCHWHGLSSPVCRTALQRGKPVITFQQGVIGMTLDAPVTATKYVAFGPTSASFMARLNRGFFQAAAMPEPRVEYISGGCLIDNISPLLDQFAQQSLLMVDVPNAPGNFLGLEDQCQAMLRLAEKLLTADLPLRRLVIRPHPYWYNLNLEAWQRLVREHPTRCEISHPAWSLDDDLRRSSAVVGILSGVLTVASACGLPAIFLETEHGYATGDLACFSPRQTLLPDAAFCEIGKILSDRNAYAEAQSEALKNAREYYTNGGNLDLSGAFFERLLRVESVGNRPPHNLQ